MEVKKADQQRGLSQISTAKESSSKSLALAAFLGGVKEEFKKITWTSPEEMRSYAKIVVGMTFCCGIAIYLVDLAIQSTLSIISSIFHFMAS